MVVDRQLVVSVVDEEEEAVEVERVGAAVVDLDQQLILPLVVALTVVPCEDDPLVLVAPTARFGPHRGPAVGRRLLSEEAAPERRRTDDSGGRAQSHELLAHGTQQLLHSRAV